MKKILFFRLSTCVICFLGFITTINAQEIAGPANACPPDDDEMQYIAGYTCSSYIWSCAGCTILSGLHAKTVTVIWNTASVGTGVTVNYPGCSSLSAQTLPVNTHPAPATPTSITGNTGCIYTGVNNLSYSTSTVSGASSYNWTVPSGWTITSGQGTQSINVTTNSSGGGNVCVTTSESYCGHASSPYCVSVSRYTIPTDISYTVACDNNLSFFSIPGGDVVGGANYDWSISPGATGWSIAASGVDYGDGFPNLWITVGSVPATVSVTVTTGSCHGNATYGELVTPENCRIAVANNDQTQESLFDRSDMDLKTALSDNSGKLVNLSNSKIQAFYNGDQTLHLDLPGSSYPYRIKLISLHGNTVLEQSSNEPSLTLNTHGTPKGIYLLIIQNDGGPAYRKRVQVN
jgi:hypothetical protein